MAEYIERESLLAKYDEVHIGEPGGARKLIAEAPSVDVIAQWISVYERLPEKNGRYLVAMKSDNGFHISTRKFKKESWYKTGRWERHTAGVRYWMPLPEAPKRKAVIK